MIFCLSISHCGLTSWNYHDSVPSNHSSGEFLVVYCGRLASHGTENWHGIDCLRFSFST